jgi:hypothetical protein
MDRREHGPTRSRWGLTPRVVGRYAVFDAIAVGGMATVHFGRLMGPAGFSRTVVIKRLHAQYAGDAEFATMFLDEARVAARVHHPNVVTVIDVVAEGSEILLVMEYVHGESLAYLTRAEGRGEVGRLRLLGNVVVGALQGLHAAHEATGENGQPLGVVHRDFSPQNILVGADGVTRVLDFGVAKAAGQAHSTGVGVVKGKVRYLAPEQARCGPVDRRTDLWAAGVMLWEAFTGRQLFSGDHHAAVLMQVLDKPIPSPRELAPEIPEAVARVILRGLERDRTRRFATALEMATALEEAVGLLPAREVGAFVDRVAHPRLAARRQVLDDIEAESFLESPAMGSVHTPLAMVRMSLAASERATVPERIRDERDLGAPGPAVHDPPPAPWRRAAAIAWGSAAGVVLAITVGAGARSLVPAHVPVAGTVAPEAVSEVAVIVPVSEPSAAPPPSRPVAPAASASARARPSRRGHEPPAERRPLSGDDPRADFQVPLYGP